MEKKKEIEFSEWIFGILFILILAVLPIIVHVAVRPINEYEFEFIRSDRQVTDVFSYYKAVVLCVFAILILINAGLEFLTTMKFDTALLKSWFVRLMLIYGVFVILSAVFSHYKSLALEGAGERYEGMWVLLSYVIIAVAAFMFVKTSSHLKFILAGMALSVLLVGGVGVFQYFGADFFKTDIAARIVLGDYYSGNNLGVKFSEVYSTLYNPDCVGLYTTLLLPPTAAFAVFLKLKNPFKYISAVLFVMLLICLIGSDSTGGMIGFLLSFMFIIVLMLIYFSVKSKNFIFAVIVAAVLIAGFCVCAFVPQISGKISDTFNALVNPPTNERFEYRDYKIEGNKGIIETKFGNIELEYNPDKKAVNVSMPENTQGQCVYGIETSDGFYRNVTEVPSEQGASIETDKGTIGIFYNGSEDAPFILRGISGEDVMPIASRSESSEYFEYNVKDYGNVILKISDGTVVLTDNNGKLAFKYENNILKQVIEYNYIIEAADAASEVRNLTVSVTPYDDSFILKNLTGNKLTKRFEFVYDKEKGQLNAVTKKGQVVDLNEEIPSMIFGNEYFANGRGFIWSRSIPLMFMPGGIFFGSGPDTFALSFPQQDLAAKVRTHGNPDIIVDKPHNMFIQISVNTGLISLIVLLVVFIIYIISTVRSLFKNTIVNAWVLAAKIGILGGIAGYLITGLTTDSVVSVAPVFWVLLGVGFALNRIKAETGE